MLVSLDETDRMIMNLFVIFTHGNSDVARGTPYSFQWDYFENFYNLGQGKFWMKIAFLSSWITSSLCLLNNLTASLYKEETNTHWTK